MGLSSTKASFQEEVQAWYGEQHKPISRSLMWVFDWEKTYASFPVIFTMAPIPSVGTKPAFSLHTMIDISTYSIVSGSLT